MGFQVSYFDSTYDLTYHRKLTKDVALDLGGRLLTADYNSGNLATCSRDDWEYSVSAGASYTLNSHITFAASYSLDLGRNNQSGVIDPSTREFNHQLISIGTTLKF